jgi:2-(1,2-epoxy-1,2-dihydrophenyl)acetyl-CoA isomerase
MIVSPNETVRVAHAGGVCTITLNRPDALNALNQDMIDALVAVTEAAAKDAATRTIVVTGAGEHFMAGGDIRAFKAWVDGEPDRERLGPMMEGFVLGVHPIIRALRVMPKPVVAAVRGSAAGFGMSLLLACDLAIAADDAVFTLAYCHIGQSPDGGSTYALPRAVGAKRAFEIAYLGDRFGAADALAMGLINRVVPAAEMDAEVSKLAARMPVPRRC